MLLQNDGAEDYVNIEMSDLEIDGAEGLEEQWGSEEELSRQASSYITENTEDSLAYDNRVGIVKLFMGSILMEETKLTV